jgi:ribokinase
MSASLKMLAIGTATQDVFLIGGAIFNPLAEKGVLYEHLPLGAKLDLEEVIFSTGGNATNAATTFARQGLDSEFMGILGNDIAATAVMNDLDAEGIDTRNVHQSNHYKTGYSTILVSPTGERTVLVYHGTPLRADGADLNLKAIGHADWLYVSSVGSMELLEKIVTLAAKNGVKVAMNPSARELKKASKLRPILDDIEVLITNKEEMKQIVEGSSLDELIRHAAQIVPKVVISDGPNGAIATDGKKVVKGGMYEDVKVVDRLGAGDAFGSGFVSMIAQGRELEEAVTFASANSTSVVTGHGAKKGILPKGTHLHDMPLKTESL